MNKPIQTKFGMMKYGHFVKLILLFLSFFFLSSKKQLSISANTLRVNLKHVIFAKFDSRFLKSAVILNVNFDLVQIPYPS